jgi:glyoxylase-like metal-dependent hydrolase (beta-lactamase superfamily II)
VVQRAEWEDAVSGLPELAGMYVPDDFVPLQEAGVLDLVDQDAELLPGVRCRLTGGHTRGHQVITLGPEDQRAFCVADLCPTQAHLETNWSMAFDQFARRVRQIKPQLLAEAADGGWTVLFSHDPQVRAARLDRDATGRFKVAETAVCEQ